MTESPPPGISEEEKPDASTSQELPVVVLGELEETAVEPGRRLLQGRVDPRYVIYPSMIAQILSGLIASYFAYGSSEWAIVPVLIAWGALFVWTWFYSIAYRYRRRLLRYFSVAILIFLSAAMAIFCIDRGAAQTAFDGTEMTARGAVPSLTIAAVLTIIGAAIIVSHILFFGRGYRKKRPQTT